jgi:hypothetical protein
VDATTMVMVLVLMQAVQETSAFVLILLS